MSHLEMPRSAVFILAISVSFFATESYCRGETGKGENASLEFGFWDCYLGTRKRSNWRKTRCSIRMQTSEPLPPMRWGRCTGKTE